MDRYDRRTRRTRDLSSGDARIYLEFEVRRVQCKRCGTVKREQLAFLAGNPFYTKRFAHCVGRRCQSSSIKDTARELNLDWDTIKVLEKQCMAALLAKAGKPGPKAIGVNEISIGKGHNYRIVVSDLIRACPIWFGAEDRSEKSMAMFYDRLGEKKRRGIRLAVMDMWKPYRNATNARAPQAAILFDKYHIMRHLGEAIGKVCKSEYAPLINIGAGADQSIAELAALVADVIGYRGEFIYDPSKPDDTPRKLLGISRILALGWKPGIGPRGRRGRLPGFPAINSETEVRIVSMARSAFRIFCPPAISRGMQRCHV